MKRTIRRTAAFALALTVLMCWLAALAPSAAGGNPVDPTWSGMTAVWKPPAKETSHYEIGLYKDGNYLSDYTTTGLSYDFSDTIKNCGPGKYDYCIAAVFEDTSKSNLVYSDIYTYAEVHPHPLKHVGFRYATCTEEGVKEHYECPVCDKYYWDYDALYEITDKSEVVLPAYGHNWGDWVIVKDPTETSEGKAQRVCSEDPDHVETKTLPKLKSESSATTAPPATEKTTAATQPTTQATQPSTAAPSTSAATKPTQPKTQPTTAPATADEGGLFGLPGILPWIILGGGILLLLLIPGAIVLIIVLTKKKSAK